MRPPPTLEPPGGPPSLSLEVDPPAAIVQVARATAWGSPCQKSRRGVVIYGPIFADAPLAAVARAYNGPPAGLSCRGLEACRASCRDYCVHAEARAIMRGMAAGRSLAGTLLVHVKVDRAGAIVTSGPPSCPRCSALVLEAGLAGVFLYHDVGWRLYSAYGFHTLSIDNQRPPQ